MHHETNKADDPYATVHDIVIPNEVNLRVEMPYGGIVSVNSRHHQAVAKRKFPDCLQIVANHLKDGTIEMLAHKTLPIVGIQAHPEDIYDAESYKFFASIIRFLITEKVSIL